MENKKTKLTISGKSKKPIKNFDSSKNLGKKTVVIEKHSGRSNKKGIFSKSPSFKPTSSNKKVSTYKSNFTSKISSMSSTSDFERRKLAEQRARKRLKGDLENSKEKKNKLGEKKESSSLQYQEH